MHRRHRNGESRWGLLVVPVLLLALVTGSVCAQPAGEVDAALQAAFTKYKALQEGKNAQDDQKLAQNRSHARGSSPARTTRQHDLTRTSVPARR